MQDTQLIEAVNILKNGGLVAFPTETVYGLGADASNKAALCKIFKTKKRPTNHPLILHIGNMNLLSKWAVDVSPMALKLIENFWPGPLTLILKKAYWVPDELTGGQDTIGVRMPNHPLALKLLQLFGNGLAAPSANQFGHISPTSAAAVFEELGGSVDMILDGGSCEVGVESTIVDVRSGQFKILRPGMITASQLASVVPLETYEHVSSKPRVSGSHDSHYSPRTATTLIKGESGEDKIIKSSGNYVFLSWSQHIILESSSIIKMPDQPDAYARVLYATLRKADNLGVDRIYIEAVPEDEAWEAIRDRLRRACSQTV